MLLASTAFFAVIAGFNPHLSLLTTNPREYFLGWWRRFRYFFPIWFLFVLVFQPAYSGYLWGVTWPLALCWIASFTVSAISAELRHSASMANAEVLDTDSQPTTGFFQRRKLLRPLHDVNLRSALKGEHSAGYGRWALGILLPVTLVLIAIFQQHVYFATDLIQWRFKVKQLGNGNVIEKPVKEMLPPLSPDERYNREVSWEYAVYKGSQALSEMDLAFKSQFVVGEYTICKINDWDYWVAPLEYKNDESPTWNWWRWLNRPASPGYIKVDAHRHEVKAEVVLAVNGKPIQMYYLSSAFWWRNLSRYSYFHRGQFCLLLDESFEPDDTGYPWVVYTRAARGVAFDGVKVLGVLIVDPQTGDATPYDLGEIPQWVERVYPEDLILQYVEWWGIYREGYWDYKGSQKGVLTPTKLPFVPSPNPDEQLTPESAPLVFWTPCIDGVSYQRTSMTTPTKQNLDNALDSFILVHPANGTAYRCEAEGPHDAAVLQKVKAHVSDHPEWMGTAPAPRLWGGDKEIAWTCPIDAVPPGVFQALAIVHESVEVASASTLSEAYHRFQLNAGKTGIRISSSNLTEATFIVLRHRLVGDSIYLLVGDGDQSQREFFAPIGPHRELLYSYDGDQVKIWFTGTGPQTLIQQFDNLGLALTRE